MIRTVTCDIVMVFSRKAISASSQEDITVHITLLSIGPLEMLGTGLLDVLGPLEMLGGRPLQLPE